MTRVPLCEINLRINENIYHLAFHNSSLVVVMTFCAALKSLSFRLKCQNIVSHLPFMSLRAEKFANFIVI